jgi:hypothetical protein
VCIAKETPRAQMKKRTVTARRGSGQVDATTPKL